MLAYGECPRCGHAVTLVSIVPTFDENHEVFTFACRECKLPTEVRCVVLIGMLPVASTQDKEAIATNGGAAGVAGRTREAGRAQSGLIP
jgi:transcription elongation factor Elf1